jgi:RimJ/RimL family protein N-acetyltransferase
MTMIRTERLTLRPLTPADVAMVYALCADPETMYWLADRGTLSPGRWVVRGASRRTGGGDAD